MEPLGGGRLYEMGLGTSLTGSEKFSYRPQKHDTHFNLLFAVVVNEAQVAAVAGPVQGTHTHSFI